MTIGKTVIDTTAILHNLDTSDMLVLLEAIERDLGRRAQLAGNACLAAADSGDENLRRCWKHLANAFVGASSAVYFNRKCIEDFADFTVRGVQGVTP